MTPIAHIVMWRLNGESPEIRHAQGRAVVEAFETLRGRIPGLLQLAAGTGLVGDAEGHDVAVYTVFESIEALHAYNEHPEHLRIRGLISPMRRSRHHIDFALSA